MKADSSFREPVVLAWLIGLAPFIILLLTWDPDGVSTRLARGISEYALPILAIEGLVIGLAALSGLFAWIARAPRMVLAAATGWLFVAFGTALFVAVAPKLSVFLTFVWVIHALFAASVAFLCREGKLDSRTLAIALLGGFIAYAVATTLFALQADAKVDFVSHMPGLGNLRRVAAYATMASALAAGVLLWGRTWLPLVAAALAFFTAFWTGGRATAPAVAAAVLAAAILFPVARDRKLALGILIAAVAGLLLALVFPVEAGKGNHAVRAILYASDNGRLRIWGLAIQAIAGSPFIGHGEGQTALTLPDNPAFVDDFQAHPHNLFLQLLMAWGAVGTAFVLVIAGWLATHLYRAGQKADSLPFVMAAGALTAHAMVDGALYDVAPVFLFAACVGSACGFLGQKPKRE